jgi:hypothetical protein
MIRKSMMMRRDRHLNSRLDAIWRRAMRRAPEGVKTAKVRIVGSQFRKPAGDVKERNGLLPRCQTAQGTSVKSPL